MTSDEDDGEFWGFVQDAKGLFTSHEDGLRQVELLGSSPQGRFLACLDHLGGRRAAAGGGHLAFLDAEGIEMGSYFVSNLTATAAKPSVRGGGLFLMSRCACGATSCFLVRRKSGSCIEQGT
ncbi:hypothetical protein [Streptomyces sp. NPDC047009]|uniref:hypothetical protein n=1 Tax=Streptomyces sp. NPDC047009 TaxID=3154496 RepID=UPI0033D36B0F